MGQQLQHANCNPCEKLRNQVTLTAVVTHGPRERSTHSYYHVSCTTLPKRTVDTLWTRLEEPVPLENTGFHNRPSRCRARRRPGCLVMCERAQAMVDCSGRGPGRSEDQIEKGEGRGVLVANTFDALCTSTKRCRENKQSSNNDSNNKNEAQISTAHYSC